MREEPDMWVLQKGEFTYLMEPAFLTKLKSFFQNKSFKLTKVSLFEKNILVKKRKKKIMLGLRFATKLSKICYAVTLKSLKHCPWDVALGLEESDSKCQ